MLNLDHRKRGLIFNVGSFAGAVPSPMLATYSGTKAFLSTFSSALGEEVRKDNITVEHLNTYFVVRPRLFNQFEVCPTTFAGVEALQDTQSVSPHT